MKGAWWTCSCFCCGEDGEGNVEPLISSPPVASWPSRLLISILLRRSAHCSDLFQGIGIARLKYLTDPDMIRHARPNAVMRPSSLAAVFKPDPAERAGAWAHRAPESREEMADEMAEALRIAEHAADPAAIRWSVYLEEQYVWADYEEWIMFLVEEAFLMEDETTVDLTEHGINWVIDVQARTQTNTQSGTVRPIRRIRITHAQAATESGPSDARAGSDHP